MKARQFLAIWSVLLSLGGAGLARAPGDAPARKGPQLPEGVKLEEQPKDGKAAKVVLVASSSYYKPGEHDYVGGCAALMALLRQTAGVAPVLALDWPKDPKTFEGARAVVFFVDGAGKHPALKGGHAAQLQKLCDAGVGLVMLHQGVDVAKKEGDRMRGWMGAAWEKGHSRRAHWVATHKDFPDHPILRGVKPFKIDDGYLYRLRFVAGMKGVTPLLRTNNPKTTKPKDDNESVVAWAYERPGGGRSFAFTGGHLHLSFAEEGYRRFLVNGILWSAKVEVPRGGAPVALTVAQLKGLLTKPPAKGK